MRVLVSGYYGLGNLGDEGLLAGLITQLLELDHEPVVLSGDPDATRSMHGVEAVHRYRELLPAILRSGAVLSGGGGLLQDTTSSRSLTYYLTVIALARRLGRRVAVYGQSIGPLSSAGRSRLKRALAGVPCAVRDTPSIELLRGLGMEADMVADPALLLKPANAAKGALDVLLIPRAGYEELTEGLIEAGREAVGAGKSVGLLAIQPAEDASEIGRLAAALPEAARLSAASPAEAVAVCASAGLVISARLHGLVFAVCAGTAHAGLVYDPKVQGFLERSQAPAFTPPLDTGALAAVVRDPPPFNLAAAAALRSSAEDGAAWLARWLAA